MEERSTMSLFPWGVAALISGLISVLANDRVAKFIIWGQNTTGAGLSEKDVTPIRMTVAVCGLLFIGVGVAFIVSSLR